MTVLCERQPFNRVKDSSIAMFWFGRYRFWNSLFRCWIPGYITKSSASPWNSFNLLLEKYLNFIITCCFPEVKSEKKQRVAAGSLSRLLYSVHQHKENQNMYISSTVTSPHFLILEQNVEGLALQNMLSVCVGFIYNELHKSYIRTVFKYPHYISSAVLNWGSYML
jgi:hypothetical protein